MATNIAVTNIDFKRFVLTSAVETGIVLEGTNVARLIMFRGRVGNIRITRTPGGTFSTDDYTTLEPTLGTDETLIFRDVALEPMDAVGTFFYGRAETVDSVLEATWGQ